MVYQWNYAVLWSPSGNATVLQDVGGNGVSQSYAINDSGQSVGFSYTSPGCFEHCQEAVLWSPSGEGTILQDAGGHGWSQPAAINASGQSIGSSYAGPGPYGLGTFEGVL